MSLPRPPEPSPRELQKHGSDHEEGTVTYASIEAMDPGVVGKRAVIDYLWEHWDSFNTSYQDIVEACGDASPTIDQWLEGEKDWSDVLDRINHYLD